MVLFLLRVHECNETRSASDGVSLQINHSVSLFMGVRGN
jgi:hypothetical protein